MGTPGVQGGMGIFWVPSARCGADAPKAETGSGNGNRTPRCAGGYPQVVGELRVVPGSRRRREECSPDQGADSPLRCAAPKPVSGIEFAAEGCQANPQFGPGIASPDLLSRGTVVSSFMREGARARASARGDRTPPPVRVFSGTEARPLPGPPPGRRSCTPGQVAYGPPDSPIV
jgi:hypothetical protein